MPLLAFLYLYRSSIQHIIISVILAVYDILDLHVKLPVFVRGLAQYCLELLAA